MPSVSNLQERRSEREGERERERERGQWRWGDSQMPASVRKETQSTIPQDFLTGSDKEHTVLTKQTNNTNVTL